MADPQRAERIVIDKGGRVVIPKPLRDRLGLRDGDLLTIEEIDGQLRVCPEQREGGLIRRDGALFKPSVREARKTTIDETLRDIDNLRRNSAPIARRGSRRAKR
jgi:AbrB family looped-hinge helix DNA binding protein